MAKKITILWIISCLLACACGKGNGSAEENLIKQLKNPRNVSEITLQEMTEFDWDYMYYFMPYIDKETVETIIGFSSDNISDNLSNDDGVYAVFVKGKEVICQIQGLPENLGFRFEFGKIDSYIRLDKKKAAHFSVEKEGKIVTYRA